MCAFILLLGENVHVYVLCYPNPSKGVRVTYLQSTATMGVKQIRRTFLILCLYRKLLLISLYFCSVGLYCDSQLSAVYTSGRGTPKVESVD